jgi:hypothetical protein
MGARVRERLRGRREAVEGRGRARRSRGCCTRAKSGGDSPAAANRGGRKKKLRRVGRARVSRGGKKCARGRERRRRRGAGAGVASPRGHAGPASGRRCGDAATAGQPAMPGRVMEGDEGLTGGPG